VVLLAIQTKFNSQKIISGSKLIGIYDPITGVFTKRVDRKRHFLKILQAWGSDKEILRELALKGCRTVRLIEKSGLVYEAPLELIFSRGIEKDLGFGPQVFLPEKEWEVKDPAQRGLFEWPV
jgi:hypothetical protein